MTLSDVRVRNAKPKEKPFKLMDELGLFLLVTPRGKKLWRYRFWLHDKEGLYAIGEYPAVTLAAARAERDNARALVKSGLHPVRQRQELKLRKAGEANNTFEAVAREWIEQKAVKWAEVRTKRVGSTLEKEVFPELGKYPIKEISSARLLQLLQKIAKRPAPSTALLVKQLCSGVFQFAITTLRADNDPTYALRRAIERPRIQHKQPLAQHRIPVLLERLNSYGGLPSTAAAIRLSLLTFVRPKEMRQARWDQFDLAAAKWTIPASEMKMREPHLVPLSRQALDILRDLQKATGHRQHLFPNTRDPKRCMGLTTLGRALDYMGFSGELSPHAFRATASTHLNELDFDSDLIERQLAHQERDATRASYNQAKHFTKRKQMMQDWADYIDSLSARNENAGI
jgi:integrase